MKTFLRAAIAGVLAICATPLLADTLVDNVEGLTIDESGELKRFTGLVFDDDGIITQVLERGDERPEVDFGIDGKGRVMMPGMIDAHVHVMDLGFGQLTLDLSDTTSLEDALAKIRAFADDNPSRPWILGRGWNQEKWGLGRFPDRCRTRRRGARSPGLARTRRQPCQLGQQPRDGACWRHPDTPDVKVARSSAMRAAHPRACSWTARKAGR
jgi:hypothetical protein